MPFPGAMNCNRNLMKNSAMLPGISGILCTKKRMIYTLFQLRYHFRIFCIAKGNCIGRNFIF